MAELPKEKKEKHILFIVNINSFFLTHRLPIALEAQRQGYRVSIATGDYEHIDKLKTYNIEHHYISLSRSGRSINKELKSLISIKKLLQKIRPDLIHNVSIKPVLYAGLINRIFFRYPSVSAITGLGYIFMREGLRARILMRVLLVFYYLSLGARRNKTIFQNNDDLELFLKKRLVQKNRTILIKGSGVPLDEYSYKPEPHTEVINILLPARLLCDKGVREFIEAAKILGPRHPLKFVLVGAPNDDNPSSIDKETLEKWRALPYVDWLGFQKNMTVCYQNCHIVCLPSYREGMPRALLEAQASGRPVVTTDVPGCREAILPGETGLLVECKKVMPLVDALEKLISSPTLRQSMGRKAREFAEREFSIEKVVEKTLNLYKTAI